MLAIPLYCPVCNSLLSQSASPLPPGADAEYFDCPRCGPYALSRTAHTALNGLLREKGTPGDWEVKKASAALSYRIRRAQRKGDVQTYSSDGIKKILKDGDLPRISEQIDNFILWIGWSLHEPGDRINIESSGLILSVIGAVEKSAVSYVVWAAEESDLIKARRIQGMAIDVTLTLKGWQRYEDLRRGKATGQTAFMAMRFGDPELDAFVNDHLRPAVAATGFRLKRLDDEPRAGLIDDRLRVEIRACRFLIADLTHGNKGAYWESGYAEGLGKPVIYTCEKGVFDDIRHPDRPHFDTNHHLTIVWEKEKPQAAVEGLKATIRATLDDAVQEDTTWSD
jgi:hypothetical protein